MTPVQIILLENKPIFEQLQLEEALLRTDDRNICLINRGSSPAIVMGISGKPETLIDLQRAKQDQIPIIQRFSGGGTVFVDTNTLFVTFIFSKNTLPIHPFPEPILRWTFDLYRSAWEIPQLNLLENDYAIGNKKCGGNAQYIQKNRWLQHTTFLWDYSEKSMNYLLMPEKRPKYRESRTHTEFLCRMKDYAPSVDFLVNSLLKTLGNVKHFYLERLNPEKILFSEHRKSTRIL